MRKRRNKRSEKQIALELSLLIALTIGLAFVISTIFNPQPALTGAASFEIGDQTISLSNSINEPVLAHFSANSQTVNIKPINSSIKEITFNNLSNAGTLGIDDPPSRSNFIKMFAIDPTSLNFTNATVTVSATGTELYKCKDWNFSAQSCYGSWTLFKTDLVPGQNYTFTLTPADPGFGEIINITKATHLDENKSFISNIFEQVKALDGNWSETIPSGHYVRTQFERNLTSNNDITIYPRTVNGTPRIEIYEVNGTKSIVSFDILINNSYNKVYLTNLNGSQNTFDFLILNGSVEFDHITDPVTAYQVEDGDGDCASELTHTTYITRQLLSSWGSCSKGEKYRQDNAAGGTEHNMTLSWLNNGGYNSSMNITGQSSGNDIVMKSKTTDASGYIKLVEVNASNAAIIQILDSFSYSMTAGTTHTTTDLSMLSGVASAGNTFGILVSINPIGSSRLETKWGAYGTAGKQMLINVDETPIISDITPPASVTNLANQSATSSSIYWNWTNPADADFNTSIVYLDGIWQTNTTNNFYNATGLSANTSHTITVQTKDNTGNVNTTNVTSTANSLIGANINIWDNNGSSLNITTTIISESGDLQNITATIQNSQNIQEIVIINHNTSSGQQTLLVEFQTNDTDDFNNTWSIDPTNLSSEYINITFTAQGNYLHKCVDWNFTKQTCNNDENYTRITSNLIPGQNYTITIFGNDPGFGETIQGPENISDAWFRGGNVNQNRGALTYLRVGRTSGVNNIHNTIWFNTSTIPTNAIIDNAELQLYFYRIPGSDSTGAREMAVHRIQQSPPRLWEELDVTWLNYNNTDTWTNPGADYNTTSTDTTTFSNVQLNSFIVWNVTTNVANFVANPTANFGWLLKDNNESENSIRRDFRSKEYGTINQRPRLVINYTIIDNSPTVSQVQASDSFQNFPVEINAAVTDDIGVDTVRVNITLPNSTSQILNLINIFNDTYSNNFTNTRITGTYNFTIIANDTGGNINNTEKGNFDITKLFGFPTADINDGRFLAIVGAGLSTVPSTNVSIFLIFDSQSTSISAILYDGDTIDNFDFTSGGEVFNNTYLIYADPQLNFSTSTLITNRSSTEFNNMMAQVLIDQNHSASAIGPDGNYYYRLDVFLDTPTATQINTFKVLTTQGGAVFFPGTEFQFIGSDDDFISAGCTPFPGCAAGINTTFFESGENFSFIVDIPPSVTNFTLEDDDADFDGDTSSSGSPSIKFINYSVYSPNGTLLATNTDPSGNYPDRENFTVNSVGPGLYKIIWEKTNTVVGGGTNPNNILFKTPFRTVSSPPFYIADIFVSKQFIDESGGNITFEDNVTYLITIVNSGNGSANISLVDIIPANTTYRTGSMTLNGIGLTDVLDGDGGDYNISSLNAVSINYTNLSSSQIINITFRVTLDTNLPPNLIISNQANVSFDNQSTISDDPTTLLVNDPTEFTVIDEVKPSVFDLIPQQNSTFSVLSLVEIAANATDNIAVDVVIANITLPNGTSIQLTLINTIGDKFSANFPLPNLTGQYNVSFFANDTSANINNTETTFFNASLIDTAPPAIFDIQPIANSTFNLSDNIEITANVTDNIAVDTVLANITFPNGTTQQLGIVNIIDNKYNVSFTIPNNLLGRYNMSFFANDSSGNPITAPGFFIVGDPIIPVLNGNITPQNGAVFNYSDTVFFSINVTDNIAVDTVIARISMPNGTIVFFKLNNTSGDIFENIFNPDGVIGIYNIAFLLNDSSDNINANNITQFEVRNIDAILDVVDRNRKKVNYTITVIQNTSGIFDAEIIPIGQVIRSIRIISHDETSDLRVIQIDKNTADDGDFLETFSLSLDELNYTFANFTVNASGFHFFKCTNFSFSNQSCADTDDYIQTATSIITGQNITFQMSASDPGFGFTLEGPANTSDARYRSGLPDNNFGGSTFLRVGRRTAGNIHRSIIKFNLTYLPAGINISQANLSLFAFRIPGADNLGARTHGVHQVNQTPNDDWSELGVTWNNVTPGTLWDAAGADFNATPTDIQIVDSATLDSRVKFNVTSDVQDFVNNLSVNFGWVIKDQSEAVNSFRFDYRSSEHGNLSVHPVLEIAFEDAQPPSVFDLIPPASTIFNISQIIEIGANVTDNIAVDIVLATITFPNTTTQQITLTNAVGDKYNATFLIPNLSGQYNVSFFANDTSNLINNSETTFFIVPGPPPPQPVLSVVKIDSSDPVQNGTQFNYTIIITNNGNGTAINVTLFDALPLGVAFVSATPAPDIANSTWFLGNISSNASALVEIAVLPSFENTNVVNNFVNVSFENTTSTLFTSTTENTTILVPQPSPAVAVGLTCLLTQTPQVVEPGEKILFQADLSYSDGVPATTFNVTGVNLTIFKMIGTNTTIVENFSMNYLSQGIWYVEFDSDLNPDANYLARVDTGTNTIPSQQVSCSEVFTIFGRGVFSLKGISPDLTHSNRTVRLAVDVSKSGSPVEVAYINNSQLIVSKINGSYIQVFNESNGLQVVDGSVFLDGSFNETGVYFLNWSLEHFERKKSTKEVIVIVDWDDTLNNLENTSNQQLISLIDENKNLLIEVLGEIEDSQDFSQEEIFLITDSVNSMSRLVEFLEDGSISPEEAEQELARLQNLLEERLGDRITGYVTESENNLLRYQLGKNLSAASQWTKKYFIYILAIFIVFAGLIALNKKNQKIKNQKIGGYEIKKQEMVILKNRRELQKWVDQAKAADMSNKKIVRILADHTGLDDKILARMFRLQNKERK